jgi:Fe2+ or Zn2+ uptake regulation protein
LEILRSSKEHPTADMVYAAARREEPSISLGTVYRNLAKLAASGDVVTLETVDKKIHYDGDVSNHQHFVCNVCGKIVDVFSEPKLPDELADGYALSRAKCVYYGVCKDCANNKDN